MPPEPQLFSSVDTPEATAQAPLIQPWKRLSLDPRYSGAWVVTGDLDGDGEVELVSARDADHDDVHYTTAVAAHRLDGEVLWVWGDPDIGRRGLHHDVACQIHDWDGDGCSEVVVCTDGFLVELDGATGAERRRLPVPPAATDCLVFADLAGRGRAAEVLVKTRYTDIWALSAAGDVLWHVDHPGGGPTAHQPFPVDVDGDSRDEVMAGYALLNPDGTVRWKLADQRDADWPGGHLDCCRVLERGPTPQDLVLVLTCCGGNRLVAVDGNGSVRWERAGHHFESIDIGRVCPERPGPQLLVDLVPPVAGSLNYPLWVLDLDGGLLGELLVEYGRFHTLVEWNGDGCDEIVVPHSRGLFDWRGRRIGTFAMESQTDIYGGRPHAEGEIGGIVLRGDLNGDGVPDLAITAPGSVYLFRNPGSVPAENRSTMGSDLNFTLY